MAHIPAAPIHIGKQAVQVNGANAHANKHLAQYPLAIAHATPVAKA